VRTVFYARVSTRQQREKQLSISAQLRALRGFAREKGWDVVEEFRDEGYSGRDAKRPGLQALLASTRTGEIDVVLVWKLDRLARNTQVSAAIRETLKTNGVRLVSLHEPSGNSPQDKLIARIFEGLAEFYSDNLSQDIRRGQREVARQGYYPFSTPPIGYTRVPVAVGNAKRFKLEMHEEFAPVIGRIFKDYASGLSVPKIVNALNAEGKRAEAGKRWTSKRVYFILSNPTYCGDLVVGRNEGEQEEPTRLQDVHPALIDRETFNLVQHRRADRATDHSCRHRESSPYLLSGLVRCGRCGRHLVGTSAKSGKYHYYTCQQYYHQGKEACKGTRVSKSDLEGFIISRARDLILDEDNLERLVSLVNGELSTRQLNIGNSIKDVEATIGNLKQRLSHHYEALETGLLVVSDVAPRIQELRNEIDELESRKLQLEIDLQSQKCREVGLEQVLEYSTKLRNTLRIGSIEERRAFLSGLIEYITVSEAEIEIVYRVPLPEEETGEDVSPVLHSVLSGGGGGSRTRVRNAFQSASTSLVPRFDFESSSPHGPGLEDRAS